jgi:glycosyltransferase involved in cell wall biosynthesis
VSSVTDLEALVADSGLRRVHLVSWRDLDDDEAGGSEVHASHVAARWAAAGLDVTLRTSFATGRPPTAVRDGFRVVRRSGRYLVFPHAAITEALGRNGPWDGFVEIWNGMPFFSPAWTVGRPSTVWLHHMHADMWHQTFADKPLIGHAGKALETRIAPLLYRRSHIVTLSTSSKHELVHHMGFRDDRVDVVPPGVDARFSPGGVRSDVPLVVAVGRLVPVKQHDVLLRVLAKVREKVPQLRAVIASEGYNRPRLEALRHELDLDDVVSMPGWMSDDDIVDLYRSAWLLAATSSHEGWDMTVTEAAACGTPAVVTDIAGHRDAVAAGRSGFLCTGEDVLAARMVEVLTDDALRHRLADGALTHASQFTWDNTALGTFRALHGEAVRRRHRRR